MTNMAAERQKLAWIEELHERIDKLEAPTGYDEVVNDFHDKLAARIAAALERLRALEAELVEIQIDLTSGP